MQLHSSTSICVIDFFCFDVRRIRGNLVPRFVDLLLQIVGQLISDQLILSLFLVVAHPTFCLSRPHFSHFSKAVGFCSAYCLVEFGWASAKTVFPLNSPHDIIDFTRPSAVTCCPRRLRQVIAAPYGNIINDCKGC